MNKKSGFNKSSQSMAATSSMVMPNALAQDFDLSPVCEAFGLG